MSQSENLNNYDAAAYPPFAVTVDIVVFTIRDDRLQILLIQRGEQPFAQAWALPGGFVREREGLELAARRELAEETGVTTGPAHLAELGAYGAPDRDPRMRVVTVAWWAIMADVPEPVAGTDAVFADLVSVDDIVDGHLQLAFDHHTIVMDALQALRDALERTTAATAFWSGGFRISDLRRVYELVWGVELEPGNFQRKVRSIDGFLEPTEISASSPAGGRPARLFRSRPSVRRLTTPLSRDSSKKPTSDG